MKVRLCDIVEIATRSGLTYAHFTHIHPEFGHMLQVKAGFFDGRPEDVQSIGEVETRYSVFVDVSAGVRKKLFHIAGNCLPPVRYQVFPIFQREWGHVQAKFSYWDGLHTWPEWPANPLKELPEAGRRLSCRMIVTPSILIEFLESDWTPEHQYEDTLRRKPRQRS